MNSIYIYPPNYEYEIIVVDNASEDGSSEMVKREFPQVLFISNLENKGFAYAVNRGIEKSEGKYMLLLNNDTLVLENSLNLLIEFMDKNPYIDICGCKLLLEEGTIQRSTQTFPKLSREFFHANPIFKKLYGGEGSFSHRVLFFFLNIFKAQWASFIDYNKTTEVDMVTGAVFMFRRNVIDKIGLFDENYFMYSEEADYCYRLKKSGGRVYYYPDASIVHLLGQTTKQDFKKGYWIANPFLIERYKSMFYFFKKHYSRIQLYLLKLMVFEGHSLRLLSNLIKWLFYVKKRGEIGKIIDIYGTIIKLAICYKGN
ncbi:MAG: glycosyltransferase [candidate division Zixibacteria bacterium]|nr:glycosyltransferase [candidate division Zixibacteria bacterium]